MDSDPDLCLEWVCVGAWAIWNDCNSVFHGRSVPSLGDKCDWVHRYIQDYHLANVGVSSSTGRDKSFHVRSTTANTMVIHVDVACNESSWVCGFGAVVRYSGGDLVAAMHDQYPSLLSPLGAEAKAVLEGLSTGRKIGFQRNCCAIRLP